MRALCTLLAVWLGFLALFATTQHHPTAPSTPDRATTTITERP